MDNRHRKKSNKKIEEALKSIKNNEENKSQGDEVFTASEIVNENDPSPKKEYSRESKVQRIVDLLDLQILLAVIVIFVSSWAYLNDRICNFSGSEPLNEQVCYILVHYILTAFLFLCIYISYIKGKYVLENSKDISENKLKYFKLFMGSWYGTLIICFLILFTVNYISWVFWCVILAILLLQNLYTMKFKLVKIISIFFFVLSGFPLFISVMTLTNKDVEVIVDKPYYSIDEDVLVTVNVKGYACSYQLACLGKSELYQNSIYELKKNMIILPASVIRNNVISVGVISPASGRNFWIYPLMKVLGYPIEYMSIADCDAMQSIYYKRASVNVKLK